MLNIAKISVKKEKAIETQEINLSFRKVYHQLSFDNQEQYRKYKKARSSNRSLFVPEPDRSKASLNPAAFLDLEISICY